MHWTEMQRDFPPTKICASVLGRPPRWWLHESGLSTHALSHSQSMNGLSFSAFRGTQPFGATTSLSSPPPRFRGQATLFLALGLVLEVADGCTAQKGENLKP